MKRLLLTAIICAVTAGIPYPGQAAARNPEFADAWQWAMPPRLFGLLSQDERNHISRGEKLLRDGHHDAAAVEFEKYIAEHRSSPVRAHALLLQGYSLHLARKRNTAIARYTELLDFYAEVADQAVPALFLMGWAHRQNGNVDRAIEAWETLVANQAYHQHPLTDRALLILASHYAGQNEIRKAERCLSLIVELFVEAFVRPERSAVDAHGQLVRLYVEEGRYPALETLLDQTVPYIQRHGDRRARADYVYGIAARAIGNLNDRRKQQFFVWFREQQPHYERARALADYFGKATDLSLRIGAEADWRMFMSRWLDFTAGQQADALASNSGQIAGRLGAAGRVKWTLKDEWTTFTDMVLKRGEGLNSHGQVRLYNAVLGAINRAELEEGSPQGVFWDALIARLVELYARMLNPERDNGLAGVVDRLIAAGRLDHAVRVVERIEHQPFALSKHVAIDIAAEAYARAAERCEEIEKIDTGQYAARALEIRAGLYHDQLARYEDAITLYRMINDPPRTDWAIVDCYEKMGKREEAVALCTQIENFFPDLASRAAYRIALIWHRANDRQRAIAAFRAVLRKYPKSREAVEAHQMQERYGFDFGGGVVDEMQ